jgi:hypothetical protein
MTHPILIETLADPERYTADQIDRARRLAGRLGRGRLVLCEAPGRS